MRLACDVMRMRSGYSARFGAAMAVGAVLLLLSHGCFFMEFDCMSALEHVCDCPSRPCDRSPGPAIVEKLRECDTDVVLTDEGHLAGCIEDGPDRYCHILDATLDRPEQLCDLDCANGCDLEASCRSYQSRECDAPPGAGGADAS